MFVSVVELLSLSEFFSSAESGFERREMQADRVTGAEAAGAKVVAASVTGARSAPNAEQTQLLISRSGRFIKVSDVGEIQ